MSKPHVFDHGGRGHRILSSLQDGPKPRADVFLVDRKAGYVLGALQRFGFVTYQRGLYGMTEAGEAALRTLDAGEPVTAEERAPNVRVFARQEAA